MQEGQFFLFQQTYICISKKIRRDLGKYSTIFFRGLYFIRKIAAIIIGIQFLHIIFDHFSSRFNNAALLLFLCQLPPAHKQKQNLRHEYRLLSCLKRFLHLYSNTSHKYYVSVVGVISYDDYFNYFSATFFIPHQLCEHVKKIFGLSICIDNSPAL